MAEVIIRKPGVELDGAKLESAASEPTLEKIRQIASKLSDKNHKEIKKVLGDIHDTLKSQTTSQPRSQNIDTSDLDQSVDALSRTINRITGLQDRERRRVEGLGQSRSRSRFSLGPSEDENKNAAQESNKLSILAQVGLLKNFTKLNPWVLAAAVAFEGLGAIVGSLIKMLGGFVASGIKMITQFIEGENKLSAYIKTLAEAVSSIPFVGSLLGSLVGILGEVIHTIESWRDIQTQLSVGGAAFYQNLLLMRKTAESTGLGLEKFASIVSSNTENFAKFGTVTTGALKFSKVVESLRVKMRDMGYSMEDVAEGIAQAMGLLGTGAAVRETSEVELAKTAESLMMEFDALAKLTGQSRKSQAEALKKQNMTAAFQMALSRMGGEQQKQVNAEMARMQAIFGDVGAEMVKLRILGMVPFTKEQQMMTVTMSDSVNEIYNLTDQIKAGAMNQEEFDKKLDATSIKALKAAGRDAKKFEPILRAAAAGIGGSAADVAKNFDEVYSRMSQFLKNGEFDEEAFKKTMEKIRIEQKARDEAAKTLNKFEDMMVKLRVSVFEKIIQPLYNALGPVFESFINSFEVKWLPYLEKNIGSLGNYLSNLATDIKQLFTNNSIQNSIIESFELLIDRMSLEISKLIGKSRLARVLGFGYNDEEYRAELDTWRKKVDVRKESIKDEFQKARVNEIQQTISGYETSLKELQADKIATQAEIDKLSADQTAKKQELEAKLAKTESNINILHNVISNDRAKLEEVKKDQEKQSLVTLEKMKNFRDSAKVTDKDKQWKGALQVGISGAAAGASIGAFGGPVGALAGGALGYFIGAPVGYFNAKQEAPEADNKMKNYLTDQIKSKQKEAKELETEIVKTRNEISSLKSQDAQTDEKEKKRHQEDIKKSEDHLKQLTTKFNEINSSIKALGNIMSQPSTMPLLPTGLSGVKEASGMATGTSLGEVNQRFGEVERRLTGSNIKLKPGANVGNNYVSKEAVAGGAIMEDTMRVIESLRNQLSGEITGINDLWHVQNEPTSKHALGKAFDMTLFQQPNLPEFKSWASQGENKNKTWADFLKSQEATDWMTKTVKAAAGDIPVDIKNEYAKKSEKATGGHMHVELRKFGSIGATGRAFENFGTQTPAMLHNIEGVFTPPQLRMIVTDSQTKLTKTFNENVKNLIDNNTRNQLDPLVTSVKNSLEVNVDQAKKLLQAVTSQIEVTKQMQESLKEVISAINKSNNHLNVISRTV